MSETKLITPLLDGFAMGNPISEHNGIRCCPAIKENTDKKYIVKIISIPATQAQMDALLLAGAFKDPSAAMDYFREKGEDVLKEAQLLKKLSKLEGFLSYEAWQMEPITRHRLGYEVYLLGSYKRSLDRYIRHNAVTHLEAVNLGLDLCNALSVCRQAGALYVNLKPANIYISDRKEYRIGDLGFIETDALRYTALPEKYQSSYTPPELYDPMATVNMTADTYALGMILYQLYNDGTLPFKGKAPEEALPSPAQADYELAEIIMKAIHPDPEQRWNDPAEMGKALASYMQRNTVNDVAITPLRIRKKKAKKQEPASEAPAEPTSGEEPEIPEQSIPEQAVSESEQPPETEAEPMEEPVTSEVSNPLCEEEPEAPEEEAVEEAVPEEETVEEEEDIPEEPEVSEDEDISEEAEVPEETEEEEQVVLSEELSRIMARAEDLIAHETPEGVQIPETPQEPDPFAFVLDEEEIDDSDIPYDPLMEEEPEVRPEKKKRTRKYADRKCKRRWQRFGLTLVSVLLAAAIGVGIYWYYRNVFLQPIHDLIITADRSQLTVQVDSPVDEELLSVTCSDNYGNTKTQAVHNGQAVFTGLQSNTMYTVRLDIDGFHQLIGKTSDIHTTAATTNIVSFTSVAGAEDGSVVLTFTVDGDEPEHWAVNYVTDGENEQRKTFSGHTATVTGLSLGKTYTFTLDAGSRLSLGGVTSLDVTASRLILAENIRITSADGNEMTIRWNSPGDVVVDSWEVRCYGDRNYDQTVTVTDTEVTFNGIDTTSKYTVEITAAGMTQPARAGITANPINIRSLNIQDEKATELKLTWEFDGKAPEGGWLVLYTIDGSENHVVKSNQPNATITPKIPGAKYTFALQAADATTVFNNVHTHTAAEAKAYDANALKADMLKVDLVKTPDEEKWHYEPNSDLVLTDQFHTGDSISVVMRCDDSFYLPGSRVKVLYVIRDAYGNVLSPYTQEETLIWKNIWLRGDSKIGELTLPEVPASAGNYVLDLYFDGMSVAQLPFTVS